jgi:glycosyltransferase involved in cell wall biosynthesis
MSIRSNDSASVGEGSRAVVIAPANPGVGGQGAAAADMALGLRRAGLEASYVGSPAPSLTRRLAGRRPLRRFGSLVRTIDRRALVRQVDDRWELAYAMPGFLPPRREGRVRVLHQATRHPREVRNAIASARRVAGGGRGFMTAHEMRRLEAELLGADLVRTESMAVAEELVSHGVQGERIVTAPPGVDLARFVPAPPFERLTIAFVGVLSLWKGLDILSALADALPVEADVAVVGGPVCSWSRRLTERTRFRRHADVPALLSKAHALVLPSATDGFGYVVLEAMASGTVPFVSPEVGAAEIVRRIDERLVQPRADFAEAVAELVQIMPLADLATRARAIAEEFDRERMAEQAARRVIVAAGAAR